MSDQPQFTEQFIKRVVNPNERDRMLPVLEEKHMKACLHMVTLRLDCVIWVGSSVPDNFAHELFHRLPKGYTEILQRPVMGASTVEDLVPAQQAICTPSTPSIPSLTFKAMAGRPDIVIFDAYNPNITITNADRMGHMQTEYGRVIHCHFLGEPPINGESRSYRKYSDIGLHEFVNNSGRGN